MSECDTEPLVVIEHLAVARGGASILTDVSMQVHRRQLHVVVGPNGAGKSTLVSALLGLLPFSGRILLNWRANGRIGFVPQTFAVDPTLPVTVADFLALTRQRRPVCLGIARPVKRRIGELLERIGLPGIARRPLAGLSGGELRRVLLANALDPEPELLLLDEPGTGLDDTSARSFETTLDMVRHAGRTTVLMITHDLDQVRRIADRVTVLDRRVIADGTAADVLGVPGVLALLPSRTAVAR